MVRPRSLVLGALVGALLFANQISAASRETLVIKRDSDHIRFSFNPSRISRARLRSLIRFSPWGDSDVNSSLFQCVAGQREYRPCGSRKLDSPNFFYNAAANLHASEKQLASYEGLDIPEQLTELATFMKRRKAFWVCLDRAELQYFRGNDGALNTTCDVVNSKLECQSATDAALSAKASDARQDAADHDWYGCMNKAFYSRFPELGTQQAAFEQEAWNKFLAAYGIREQYIPSREDRD